MFLVFQLRAPLGAFGNAQADVRHTATTPRKSAILGLLAAALGLDRTETEAFARLARDLSVGTAELKEPHLLVDFHTVQSPVTVAKNSYDQSRADQLRRVRAASLDGSYKSTIVTRRSYLQDGHWLIALSGPAELLAALKAALEAPKFTLYLGRKSCPLSAFTAPLLVVGEALEDALAAWAADTKTALPASLALTWDAALQAKTAAMTETLVTDQRQTLQYPHFAPRSRREGVWNRQDV